VEVSHETARDESVCGVFCDAEPEVSFEAFGYTFHWCRDCYEGPCNRCHEPIPEDTRGSTRAKGWCEDCREEVKLVCGDDDRGIQKENGEEQAKLLTDGGEEKYEADPCVKHRCARCHIVFDSVMNGSTCPDCGGASVCSIHEGGCT